MLGEILALLAPMCWSVAVIFYRKTELPAPGMNLFKNALATVLLVATMGLAGIEVDWQRSVGDWLTIAGSGLLGLAVADTLLFDGLRRIGASRLALVDTTYAPAMVAMAWLFLGERPGLGFGIGALLVVGGVAVATVDLREAVARGQGGIGVGVLMAFAAVIGSGASVILVKPILETSDLVEITTLRLLAGVLGQGLFTSLTGGWSRVAPAFRPSPAWWYLVPGAFLGTYLALLCWLGGFKWADASVASVLNQLATVYIVTMAWVFLGERIGPAQVVGGAIAVVGAVVVLLA